MATATTELMTDFCRRCGQFNDEATTEKLWDIYDRMPDQSHHHIEPPVFGGEDLNDADYDVIEQAMGRNMHERGLCVDCGRPDITGVDPDTLMTHDEARELAEMYAEQAAEMRAGC